MTDSPRRLNTRVLTMLLVAGVVLAGLVFAVHRYQVRRNAGGLASLARAKLADGKKQEAAILFARYLTFRPNDAAAHVEFARLVISMNDRPEASRKELLQAYGVLDTAVRKNPGDDALRRTLVNWMMRFGRFADAVNEIDFLRERGVSPRIAPEDGTPAASLDVLRAYCLNGLGRYQEAATVAAEVIGFDLDTKKFRDDVPEAGADGPAAAEDIRTATVLLATLLSGRLREPDAASEIIEHLAPVFPDDFQSWLVLTRWRQSRGDFAGAAAAVRRASEIAPDEPDVLFTDLELSLAEGRIDVADQLAQKARRLFPTDDRSYRGQASVALRREAFDAAATFLREGLAEQPGRPELLLMLAEVLLKSDRLDEADAVLTEFVDRYGGTNNSAGMLQCRLLVQRKEWLPARQKLDALRPLVAASEDLTKQVDLMLGQCHEMLGQFDEQLSANRRVLADDQDSIVARVGVAAALLSSGKIDAAAVEYEGIATALGPERLAGMPQVWSPLLQLRLRAQRTNVPRERDWSRVDALLDVLAESPAVSSAQLATVQADVLVRKGDTAAAIKVLKAALDVDGSNPRLLAALALLTLRQNGPAAARELLAQAPAGVADDPVCLLVKVQTAASEPADRADAALAELRRTAAAMPVEQALPLLTAIGTAYRGIGRPDDAERVWREALEKRPSDLRPLTLLFELACDRMDAERVRSAAEEIAKLAGPASPEGRLAEAAALIVQARIARAASADQADDGGPAGDSGLGLPPEQDPQLLAAKNLLIEAENDRPGWAQIQQLFADLALMQGDAATAIERLQESVRLGSTAPVVIRQLVSLLLAANRLDEAQQTLSLVGTEGLGGMERLSTELDLKTGQFDQAVAMAERSLGDDREASAADLIWFGQVLSRAGKFDRACDVLEKAVEAAPEDPAGWLLLFAAQLSGGQRRPAERTVARMEEHLPSPRRELACAQGHEALGNLAEAERCYRAAAAAAPTDPQITLALTAFFLRRGRLGDARAQLETLMDLPGDSPAVQRARRSARQSLAQLAARTGTYKDVEKALALVDGNADSSGRLAPADLATKIGLVASRPEPRNWNRALELLGSLEKLQPLTQAQRLDKARLLEQVGRWPEARDELLSLVSAPTTPPQLQALLVEKLIKHGDNGSARLWLKTLASRIPDAPAVLALEAQLCLAENDRSAAMAAVRRLMPGEEPPPALEGQLGTLGLLLENLGFEAAADRVLTRYAATGGEGMLARAGFLARRQRGDEAFDLLESDWDRIPLESLLRQAVAICSLLGTSATKPQFERVDRWFARARREDPDSPSLTLLRADFLSLTGQHDEAVASYRELLSQDRLPPLQAAIAANNLAFLLATPETAAEAERLVAAALEEIGPHPDVLDTRGVVLLAAGKQDEAVSDLKEAVLMPSATKYLHLAVALLSREETEAAREALAEARKLGLDARQLGAGDRRRLESLEKALGS